VDDYRWNGIEPVLRLLGITPPPELAADNLFISGIAYDSRQVRPGHAFVCIPGSQVDGNQFVGEAIRNGASCIFSEKDQSALSVPNFVVPDARLALGLLADSFYRFPSRKMRVLGITGTNGKTTATHLVEHILNSVGRSTGLIGTLGGRWPGQPNYQNIRHTTPQSSDLHRLLAAMADAGCSHVSMEVSSHALVLKRIAGCHFASVCLTNISQDHLDFHVTMDSYWQAKRLLFEGINDSVHANRSAVVNLDDPLAGEFLKVVGAGTKKWTYGWDEEADLHVQKAEFDFSGTRLALRTPDGDVELKLRLTGRFNVYNTMTALMICLAEGVDLTSCKTALEAFSGVSGRFEVVSADPGSEPLCIVDYAHTPDGLDNVLRTARSLVPTGGRLIVVFGCGGDRDASKRPQMGEIAESHGDEVVVTSDNPRSEEPQQIIANILAGITRMKKIRVEPDRARAIRLAIGQATSQDVVVVAGKGHENYQILAERTIPFDDRTEVRLALKERATLLREGEMQSNAGAKQ